jgi:hypothetical protein
MEIPEIVGDIIIEGKEVNEYRTVNEMDLKEGSDLKVKLSGLGEMILKKEKLTSVVVEKAVEAVRKVPLEILKRNITSTYLKEVKEMIEKYKNEIDISCLMEKFLFEIGYRGVTSTRWQEFNYFKLEAEQNGIVEYFEERVKRIVNAGEESERMSEKEERIMLIFSLLMKWEKVERQFGGKLVRRLLRIIFEEPKSPEERERRKTEIVALRCLCENLGFSTLLAVLFCFIY